MFKVIVTIYKSFIKQLFYFHFKRINTFLFDQRFDPTSVDVVVTTCPSGAYYSTLMEWDSL